MKKSVKEILKLFAMDEIGVPLEPEENKIFELYKDCESKYKKEYKKEYKSILREYKDELLNAPKYNALTRGCWYKFRYESDISNFFNFTLKLVLDKKAKGKVFKKNYYDDVAAISYSNLSFSVKDIIDGAKKGVDLYDIRRFIIEQVSESLKCLDELYSTSAMVPNFQVFNKKSNLLCAEDIEHISDSILRYIIYTSCEMELYESDEYGLDIINVPLEMHPEYSIKIEADVDSDEEEYDEEEDSEDEDEDDEDDENESDIIKSVILDSLFKDSNNGKSDSSEETIAKADEDATKSENESEEKTNDNTSDI